MADPTIPPPPPGFTIDAPMAAPAPVPATPQGPVTLGTPQPKVPTAPTGYRFTQGGQSLEPIPGGPAENQGLTPDALNAATDKFILTGQMDPMGMGGGPVRLQILNNRAVRLQKYGINDQRLPAIQQEFKADAAAYNDRVVQLSFQRQALDAFNQHAQQILGYLKSLPAQSDYRALNAVSNAAQRQASGDTITQLDATIPLLETEVAKIMTANPSGSGQLTDDARHEFDILNSNASPQSKILALQALAQMSQAKIDGNEKVADQLSAKMNGGLAAYAPGGGPGANGPTPTGPNGRQQQLNTAPGVGADIGFNRPPDDPRGSPMSPQQTQAFHAWLQANPNATPDQLTAFVKSMGLPGISNAEDILKAAKNGTPIGPAIYGKPDISDVRGNNPAAGADATIRNAADVLSFGTADKLAAVGDTIFGGGTMADNLAREYAITDYDRKHHPLFSLAGQVAGGLALPFGDVKGVGDLARTGAVYGGLYGLGSSRSLGGAPVNALMGAAAGAATPYAIRGIGEAASLPGKGINALRGRGGEAPPLIDPMTGEINNVLDSQRPGQRAMAINDAGVTTQTPAMSGGKTARVVDRALTVLPGSAGVMEDVYSQANRELRQGAANVASKYGRGGTLADTGAKVQQAVLDYKPRFEATADALGKTIPIAPDAQAKTFATQSYLMNMRQRFSSNPALADVMRDPTLEKYGHAFTAGSLSWQDLRAFRSEIGNQIGERSLMGGDGPSVQALKGLYAALSQDMEETARAQGPAALRALQRFNNFYENGRLKIDNALSQFLGKELDNSGGMSRAEAAVAKIQAFAKSGRGSADFQTLAALRSATQKSGVWGDVAATLIQLGGKPAGGEGREFSPQTFVNWYAGMTNDARNLLFGGQNNQLRQSLDKFVAANKQLAKIKALSNTSNTAPSILGGEMLLGLGSAAMTGNVHELGVVGAQMASSYGLAKLWTWPKFVNWATGYSKALASGNTNAIKSQAGRLSQLATVNPDVRGEIVALQQRILSAFNDNMPKTGQAAASPNQRPDQQK